MCLLKSYPVLKKSPTMAVSHACRWRIHFVPWLFNPCWAYQEAQTTAVSHASCHKCTPPHSNPLANVHSPLEEWKYHSSNTVCFLCSTFMEHVNHKYLLLQSDGSTDIPAEDMKTCQVWLSPILRDCAIKCSQRVGAWRETRQKTGSFACQWMCMCGNWKAVKHFEWWLIHHKVQEYLLWMCVHVTCV